MRTLTDLFELLAMIGFPLAYHHFEEGHSPAPPFLIYLVTESENMGADNVSYQKQEKILVELYVKNKDLVAEKTVESLFDNHHIYFDKVETYISSEKLYQISYTITLLGG